MLTTLQIIRQTRRQSVPDVTTATLPDIFRGRPEVGSQVCPEGCSACQLICPTNAIALLPLSLDLGACVFCGECVQVCSTQKITFTNDYKIATNVRGRLIIRENNNQAITIDPDRIRTEIKRLLGRSLKLYHIAAGGDAANEWELLACSNVNFDMSRFGITFVSTPLHADGIVITGPLTANIAEVLLDSYNAIPEPKLVILVGTEAISGGIFKDSPALDRSFLDTHPVDLYIPGQPAHPLTFINGLLDLLRSKSKSS